MVSLDILDFISDSFSIKLSNMPSSSSKFLDCYYYYNKFISSVIFFTYYSDKLNEFNNIFNSLPKIVAKLSFIY